jgi:hypothetical protein
LKSLYCPAVDLAYDPNAPPSAPCDALSFAVIIHAKQTAPGVVAATPAPVIGDEATSGLLPPSVAQCAPGVNPETDTCGAPADP